MNRIIEFVGNSSYLRFQMLTGHFLSYKTVNKGMHYFAEYFHGALLEIYYFQHYFLSPRLLRKSIDWFLYDNGLRHERVNQPMKFIKS